jgi:hypothetical protein
MSAGLTGLYVFPCRFDKTPAVAHGFKSASNDPAVIDLWRKRYLLMGAPTGAVNGFDVLDIDTKNNGEAWLAEFEATHGFPLTRIHATRSGGLHFFFQHRPGLRLSAGLIAPGVDIRATGGYVIWWPLAGCRVLSNAPIAPWPGPMLQLLHEASGQTTPKNPFMSPPGVRSYRPSSDDYKVPDPLYRKMRAELPGVQGQDWRRVRGLLKNLVEKRPGDHRNKALYRTALDFRELIDKCILTRDAAKELLFMAAELNGHLAKRGKKQTDDTIKSGLGHQTPSGDIGGFSSDWEVGTTP